MKNLLLSVLVTALFTGCASLDSDFDDIEFISEVHPRFDLDGYGSYDWAGNASLVYDPSAAWEPPDFDMDEEIKFLIDTELRDQGLIQTSNNPDLVASFALIIQMEELPFNQDPNDEMPDIADIPQGALAITLTDTSLGMEVWVGIAVADTSEAPATDRAIKRLEYVVTELLNTIPD